LDDEHELAGRWVRPAADHDDSRIRREFSGEQSKRCGVAGWRATGKTSGPGAASAEGRRSSVACATRSAISICAASS
jgi:hypothetical protein